MTEPNREERTIEETSCARCGNQTVHPRGKGKCTCIERSPDGDWHELPQFVKDNIRDLIHQAREEKKGETYRLAYTQGEAEGYERGASEMLERLEKLTNMEQGDVVNTTDHLIKMMNLIATLRAELPHHE